MHFTRSRIHKVVEVLVIYYIMESIVQSTHSFLVSFADIFYLGKHMTFAVMILFGVSRGKALVQKVILYDPDVLSSHVIARLTRTMILTIFVRESTCKTDKLVNPCFILQTQSIILGNPISTWILDSAE